MKAQAPGKLILSGEHAVLHGYPAIAMAVDRYAHASLSKQDPPGVAFDLLNIQYHKSHTLNALKRLKRRLLEDYQAFLRGEYSIRDVLKKPFELSQFALTHFFERFNLPLDYGLKLSTDSSIPIGCGMGSSAAMILSVLHAFGEHFNLNLAPEHYITYGMEAENLQHGQSSGLDLHISLQGGCLRFEQGQTSQRPLPQIPMYMVNTGHPECSTGECVSHTQTYFKNQGLGPSFAQATEKLEQGLANNNQQTVQQAIKENHQLLLRIGVVPDKIQIFINDLEAHGGAAKICGAGAVRGQQAGIVLIVSEKNLAEICHQHGFNCTPIHGESHGLRTV